MILPVFVNWRDAFIVGIRHPANIDVALVTNVIREYLEVASLKW